MEMLLTRFAEMGLEIVPRPDGVRVAFSGRLRSIDVATLPYPGVATDYKPLLVAMLSVAGGTGIITENLYPGRFRYVEELRKLGADIVVDGHHAVVTGRDHLTGAEVRAPDIRAGAALVVAGLGAIGMTEITDIGHIERGYDDLVGRLASIGGAVTVID
jgi:UDP-N-acetylglucosamine 1-carboxyvinyltransferase